MAGSKKFPNEVDYSSTRLSSRFRLTSACLTVKAGEPVIFYARTVCLREETADKHLPCTREVLKVAIGSGMVSGSLATHSAMVSVDLIIKVYVYISSWTTQS